MSKKVKIGCLVALVLFVIFALSMFGFVKNTYNGMVTLDEDVNQTWAQVQNVYQRRFDLIPNLVETVKGYAKHEQETFQAVTEARSKVGGVTQLRAEDLTPENLAKFQQAQAGLSGAMQRLMVVMERYPDLKANQNFIRLQDELAGTENRIAVERKRFNEAVQRYNRTIRQFPQNILAGIFGFVQKPYFEADQQAQTAPKVEF
ncbi:LemA family protein [candidate division KSB1 bacterium]|nr:LemA family protein [candidate division KSB1 bacterium]